MKEEGGRRKDVRAVLLVGVESHFAQNPHFSSPPFFSFPGAFSS
jgi:hypothetical protein